MLWVAKEEAEAEYVLRLLEKEKLQPKVRFAPRLGRISPRWIVSADIDDYGTERRLGQRLAGLLPRDWA